MVIGEPAAEACVEAAPDRVVKKASIMAIANRTRKTQVRICYFLPQKAATSNDATPKSAATKTRMRIVFVT